MSVAQAGTAGVVGREPKPSQSRRRRSSTGYLLLLPGMLWLLLFFVVPTIQLVATSLYNPDGSLELGYVMDWSFSNYLDVLKQYQEQFLRSFGYAASATVISLLLAYPLAYSIAYR